MTSANKKQACPVTSKPTSTNGTNHTPNAVETQPPNNVFIVFERGTAEAWKLSRTVIELEPDTFQGVPAMFTTAESAQQFIRRETKRRKGIEFHVVEGRMPI